MNKKKIATTTEATGTNHTTIPHSNPISNPWIDNMFDFVNTKITNQPKFKQFETAAKALANLIVEIAPPGEGQKVALEKLSESYLHAGSGFVRNAGFLGL